MRFQDPEGKRERYVEQIEDFDDEGGDGARGLAAAVFAGVAFAFGETHCQLFILCDFKSIPGI